MIRQTVRRLSHSSAQQLPVFGPVSVGVGQRDFFQSELRVKQLVAMTMMPNVTGESRARDYITRTSAMDLIVYIKVST